MMAKKVLRLVQVILVTGGLLLAARPLYHYCRWKVNEITARASWEEWQASYHEAGRPGTGTPAAWLRVPGVGLNTLVLYGADEENLLKYPCLETTSPGLNDPGVKAILGHRDMHFRKLKDIKIDHVIELQLPDKKIKEYRVKEIEILTPEQAANLLKEKKHEDRLILMTCFPFKYIGPAPMRYLIYASGGQGPAARGTYMRRLCCAVLRPFVPTCTSNF